MIWETTTTTRPPSRTSARETLVEEVLSLCASAGELDSHELRELAAGIACHAEELPRPPAGRSDLSRLTARALGSLGRPDAARRVLVLGSGLVRSSEWLAASPRPVWALDLHRLLLRDADHLELALFLGLDVILDAIAGLWDASSGAGILGLRRSNAASRLLLGPATSRARIARLRREVRGVCEKRLEILAAERGWSDRPQVLFTDSEPL
jgi:hypothetical protein